MLPKRREDALVVQELPDETLVYDLKSNKAHCLNRTAALVWRHCDGRTTVAKIAELLHDELDIPADQQVVWLALSRLEQVHMLQEPIIPAPDASRLSRREWVRRVGVAALLPAVMTIIAPTAAQALSCVRAGGGCTGLGANTECCSGICIDPGGWFPTQCT